MALTVKDGNGVSKTIKTSTDGSDLVPHHNVDTITNPVNSAQSGAWTVSITGTLPAWTGALNLGKAEDAAHTTGDVGVMSLGVRRDTLSTTVNADGDYHPILFDSSGRLYVASTKNADVVSSGGSTSTVKRVKVSATVGTDFAVVAAVTSKKIRVLGIIVSSGGNSGVTFTSKPAGAGTAISSLISVGANDPTVLPVSEFGWFETAAGEGLSVTVATTTADISVVYIEV